MTESCYVCKKEITCSCDSESQVKPKHRSCSNRDTYPQSRLTTEENGNIVHVHLCSKHCDVTDGNRFMEKLRRAGCKVISQEE